MKTANYICSVVALLSLLMPTTNARMQDFTSGHWQEGGAMGTANLSGTLYVRGVTWQWHPQILQMSNSSCIQAGLRLGKQGMMSESSPGQLYYILGGHTTTLTTVRPGLQPSVSLLQTDPVAPRLEARGELAKGQVRYGEITFSVRHVLAWQDSTTADSGWSVVSGDVTPDMEQQIKNQLWQVTGYDWEPVYSGLTARPDAFTAMPDSIQPENKTKHNIAGAWVTALEDIRVRFPGAEEPVKRWQGNLTPVVMYF